MRLAIVVPFLNEEAYLDTFLETVALQERPPDRLVLVDDGSTDASAQIAARFAHRHDYATLLRRPPRPPSVDRLIDASELIAFRAGVDELDRPYDLLAKVDGDLRLTPDALATIEREFERDPGLGMAGAYLSARARDGRLRRERNPEYHVRGPNKFYRRQCYEDIMPFPPIMGWDTIDELKARMLGWRTASFALPGGDPEHLRPTGSFDGTLRAYRRVGLAAYASGAHPLWILLGAGRRVFGGPPVLGSVNYLAGWALAALRRAPRADPEVRAFARREQFQRIRRVLRWGT